MSPKRIARLRQEARDRILEALVRRRPGLSTSARAADLAGVLAGIETLQTELAAWAADGGEEDQPRPTPASVHRRLESMTRQALDLGAALGLHDDG